MQLAAACRDPLSPAAFYPQHPVLPGALQVQPCNTVLGSHRSRMKEGYLAQAVRALKNQQLTCGNMLNFCCEIASFFPLSS